MQTKGKDVSIDKPQGEEGDAVNLAGMLKTGNSTFSKKQLQAFDNAIAETYQWLLDFSEKKGKEPMYAEVFRGLILEDLTPTEMLQSKQYPIFKDYKQIKQAFFQLKTRLSKSINPIFWKHLPEFKNHLDISNWTTKTFSKADMEPSKPKKKPEYMSGKDIEAAKGYEVSRAGESPEYMSDDLIEDRLMENVIKRILFLQRQLQS